MAKVAILPIQTETGGVSYRAVAGDKQTHGKTAGEALDALTAQLSEEETGTLVIVQSLRPDRFFSVGQQKRLAELMERWRTARDRGETLPANQQAELEALVEAELRASADRAAALAGELGR
jgi:DNA-binding transcriptional regulator YbjK